MTGFRSFVGTAFAALVAVGGLVGAAKADGPVVVELFTSQGCSSCPPADALIAELAMMPDVIALALHVDYWDYIGWADTFADPAYTQRQHRYAYAAGSTVVYTPQMVIGGQDHVIGHRPMAIANQIREHLETDDPVQLVVEAQGGTYRLRAEMRDDRIPEDGMVVQLVSYRPYEQVEIRRGENANRVIAYHNIVMSWQVIEEWTGAEVFEATVEPQAEIPYVVIVQAAGQGPIMAAARLD